MKKQLMSIANFGSLTAGMNTGKMALMANGYDFEIEMFGMNADKSFASKVAIPFKREELYVGLVKSVIQPYIENFNRIKYKTKELTSDTTFADIRYVTRSLYGIELKGTYTVSETSKKRRTFIQIYKLDSWDDKKAFYKDAVLVADKLVFTLEIPVVMVASGSWTYEDIIALEELSETASDAYFKRNLSYTNFLEEVANESKKPVASGNNGYNKPNPPKGIPTADADVSFDDIEDDFDF